MLAKHYKVRQYMEKHYLSDNVTSTLCHNTFGANCQGAPCFPQNYDGMWNVTCLCQVTPNASHYAYSSKSLDNDC